MIVTVSEPSGLKGLPPEDPERSHSPDHVPSTTQMGQVRIWKISDYQSKSGRIWSLGSNRVAVKLDYKVQYIK